MCATSAIIDNWTNPLSPNYVPWSPAFPSPNLAQEMLTVIAKLEDIDRRLKALDCKIEERTKRRFKSKLKTRASSKPVSNK